ncbi:hypothetical protein D9758_005848 [Tetrapyrgos nigripes]|uniref:NAD-dependent epimerase/dehydratase domain-containing protein n=1 Tax=Tetrapyrgos nigripes TaxID=182062 RepID=A0A8H5LHI5_9AGAR|nr:hypothetical protein D9758_005848 [Tetrapyrgos nigripes]
MAQTVLVVTGASGFVGSHVVKELLERGYNVVAVARGSKADHIQNSCDKYEGRLRVLKVTDLAKDDLSEGLQGASAVIHVATPIPGKASLDALIPDTKESCMNIIRQAEKAGVKSIVITGTLGSVINFLAPQEGLSNSTYNPMTEEEALASGNSVFVYGVAKKYAELAVWEWATAHPHFEVTIIYPPLIFGPYAPEFFPVSPQNHSSNQYLYGLLEPEGKISWSTFYVDVRDLAKAHVNALNSPPTADVGRKRVIIGSPYPVDGKRAIEILAENRPQWKSRLNKREPPKEISPTNMSLGKFSGDFARVEEVLGIKETEFVTFEQTILDMMDQYIVLEDEWKKQGLDVSVNVKFGGLATSELIGRVR